MQPPADTPGLCTPGHSVLSAASGMLTPFAPFLESFFSMLDFMNFAGGRTSAAEATPAIATTSAHASASTTLGLKRIVPPWDEMRAHAPECARLHYQCPPLRQSNGNVHWRRAPRPWPAARATRR